MAVQSYNLSILEDKAEGPPQIRGQSGLPREFKASLSSLVSKKSKTKEKQWGGGLVQKA